MFKNLLARIIGKKVETAGVQAVGGTAQWELSKAKLTALVYVVVVGLQELSKAWGHPIEIPPFVFNVLQAAGIWTVRDAIK